VNKRRLYESIEIFKKLKIIPMKFSQKTLLKLKKKNKKLKPDQYKKLKRDTFTWSN
jgi:hypothetical protein